MVIHPINTLVCGAKYKTRPGLSYHYNHTHRENGPIEEHIEEHQNSAPSSPGADQEPVHAPVQVPLMTAGAVQ